MISCPSCSADNSGTSKFCSECGAALSPEYAASLAVLYIRFGLVSAISGAFAVSLLNRVPHATDFAAWYADAGKFALAAVLFVAGYGFYCSTLAARNLITDEL